MEDEVRPYSDRAIWLAEKDEELARAINSVVELPEPSPSVDIYFYLLRSIVSQQLSVKVAAIIWQRFQDLFPGSYPKPDLVLNTPDEELRSIGLSRQKLGYMKNVAQFALEEGMAFELLNQMDDKSIIDYLTQIKGVGKWTVQMVLMFPMDRPDVFPVDDLGIQVKMIKYYALKGEKKELRKRMIELAEEWKPYRSMASKLLWRAE